MAKQPSLAQRARKNPGLLRRALKQPGLRSQQQRAQRTRNAAVRTADAAAQAQRAAANRPVVPGGTLTRGQLRTQANAATRVRYGPLEAQQRQQVGEAQTYQRDIGGYYDQYLNQVAQQAASVKSISNDANAAMARLQGGVTGLAAADLTGIQGQANRDARARGVTAGDQTQMASNAAAVRQALVGTFAAEQAGRGDAAARYSNMLARVVAPGQKLQAVAQAAGRVRQAQEAQGTTAREKGAFKLTQRQALRSDEAKNVLARQIAGVSAAGKQATLTETVRSHKANERAARARIQAGRETAADRSAIAQGKINAYGYSDQAWRAMTVDRRRQIIAQSKAAKGKGAGAGGKGPKLLGPGPAGTGITQVALLKQLAQKARAGQPFDPAHKAGGRGPLNRRDAAVKLIAYSGTKLKNPVLASAALDAAYDGVLGDVTVQRLRAAGYRPNQVAQALGVQTAAQRSKRRASQNTQAYGKTPPQPQGHA